MGNETWLDCEKLGVNKTKVTIKNHAEDHTKSIDCPLFLSNFEPRPLIIRIEEKCKKICGLMFDPNCNAGSLVRHLAAKTFWRLYNTKISKYTCHRLPFYAFRNKFECLETRPFNFERNGLFGKVSVAFSHFTVC